MTLAEFVRKRALRVSDDRTTQAAQMTLRQSIYPMGLVTLLFFLWGFSYGLLDTLNKHFQDTLNINQSRSSGLQAAYFGAYPLASLGHAAWILRHYGYRATFIWGLCLYGIGALVAIAAVKAHSFGGFCACIFVIGNGLGSLEAAANPYITICGPPRYSEMRINISQTFNGIGTVVAPVMGSYVFFAFSDEKALQNVQWVYLAIAVFVFLLAGVFFLSDIPEITDADMEFQAIETNGAGETQQSFWKQYRLFHASFAQLCYTGSQVAIAGFFINYVTENRSNTSKSTASQFLAGAQGAFAVGRIVGVVLMKWVRPRIVFLGFLTMCIVFIAPAIDHGGDVGLAMLYLTLFFESVCFPTIIALGLKGLGRHTKRGAGFIIGGVVGGACVPPLQGFVGDKRGSDLAMVVPLCFFVAAWTFAVAANFAPWYRNNIDAFSHAKVGLHEEDGGNVDHTALNESEKTTSGSHDEMGQSSGGETKYSEAY